MDFLVHAEGSFKNAEGSFKTSMAWLKAASWPLRILAASLIAKEALTFLSNFVARRELPELEAKAERGILEMDC